ncbi:hypothetical protein [Enterovirga sp. CN4-39]|uniref:hypothetical protein n=1 Tax=Enterovirga sp. CN4-39 TaxID=3400910 RepID=UPI003C10C662
MPSPSPMSGTKAGETKPKVYAFVNGSGPMGYFGAAIAEDGTVLPAGHCSSAPFWARHDMGADGHCTWKHDVYAAHYPNGFEVEWVDDVEAHPVLWPIIEALNSQPSPSETETGER